MNRQLSAWEELLKEATSVDYDEMQDAMFRVSLVLERHNYPKKMTEELYEEYLPRELLRLVLDEKRQADTIDFLVGMVRGRKEDADTFLYAMAKAKPTLILEPLLKLYQDFGERWYAEAKLEAVTALDLALKATGENAAELLAQYDPSELLDEWADDPNEELADKADRVLEKIENLLGTGD